MVMAVVIVVIMAITIVNTHLEAQDKLINDSSISATQITVKYDEVDGGGGKSVKKSSKSRRIVKKPEKPQNPEKVAQAIGSEERSSSGGS